jgi:hypothetical protein
VNNFWNNRTRPAGPLFKKSGVATQTPPPASGSVPTSKSNLSSSARSTSGKVDSLSSGPKTKFDHDIACGVYVGAFEVPGWVASLDVMEVTDPTSGRVERHENWLRPNDMLAILTREYGKARQKASAVVIAPDAQPHVRAQLTKEREESTRRTNEMRDQVVCLLQSRHVYVKAGELGLKVLIPAP